MGKVRRKERLHRGKDRESDREDNKERTEGGKQERGQTCSEGRRGYSATSATSFIPELVVRSQVLLQFRVLKYGRSFIIPQEILSFTMIFLCF